MDYSFMVSKYPSKHKDPHWLEEGKSCTAPFWHEVWAKQAQEAAVDQMPSVYL